MESMKKLAILDLLPWISKVLPAPIVSRIFNQDIVEKTKVKFFAYFKVSKDKTCDQYVINLIGCGKRWKVEGELLSHN